VAVCTVNGVRLAYEERGRGDPILCIHGAGSSAQLWADAAVELAQLGRSNALAAAMPSARLVVVGGGHLIDPAAPDVLAFVREVLSASA
jgi:hypothetical protein